MREQYNDLGRAIVVNIYWDGAAKPAVSVPLADFFGQPLQVQKVDTALFNASNGWGLFHSMIPMPFRKSARIELVNDSDISCLFYYQVNVNYEKLSENAMYLHAYWGRNTQVSFRDEFTVLPEVRGQGRYLGTTWAVIQNDARKNWTWYVRPVKIDFDDKKNRSNPEASSIHVNTLDDNLASGWWSSEQDPEAYMLPYLGRSYVHTDAENSLSVVCYRYYVIDSLWFHQKLSMRIGPHLSKIIPDRTSDWSTTAYFYLTTPENNLLAIQDAEVRTLGFWPVSTSVCQDVTLYLNVPSQPRVPAGEFENDDCRKSCNEVGSEWNPAPRRLHQTRLPSKTPDPPRQPTRPDSQELLLSIGTLLPPFP